MNEREHRYEDADGVVVQIGPSTNPGAALVFPDPNHDDLSFEIPAHRLAEFTRALYAAAGQPVPDLPVIYDPDRVEALASDLKYANEGVSGSAAGTHYVQWARTLLSLGWRKP